MTTEHIVRIYLKTKNIFDLDSRLVEITQLRVWLDELTEWQPDSYYLNFHASGDYVTAWFAKEEHAVICGLKWG